MPQLDPAEIKKAEKTGTLHLAHRGLKSIPPEVFKIANLRRLDVGWNSITHVSPAIAKLTALEELWINCNPLVDLPPEIFEVHSLRVLDLRKTKLRRLPNELGRLRNIQEIDLRGCSLKVKQQSKFDSGGTQGLMEHLKYRDLRKRAKEKLEQRMREGIYRELYDAPGGIEAVRSVVKQTFLCFDELDDVKNVIRNCERLFPENIDDVDVEKIKERYVSLRTENERKKLSAELELKIRVIYFDRVKPENVEGMVHDIYDYVLDIDDIRFLLRYAPRLFPETVRGPRGAHS